MLRLAHVIVANSYPNYSYEEGSGEVCITLVSRICDITHIQSQFLTISDQLKITVVTKLYFFKSFRIRLILGVFTGFDRVQGTNLCPNTR